MTKNVRKAEQIVRIVLGIVFGLLTCLATGWPTWARIGSSIVAVAFLVTALVGY